MPNLPQESSGRQASKRCKSGKKAPNDLKYSFEPCVRGLQEGFFRCLKREYIQIISRSGCSAHAAPGLRRARHTRAISTWKSVLPAIRFSPASRSWWIRQDVWSVSVASMPSPTPARQLPRRSKRGWSFRNKASGDGGLCFVGPGAQI